MPRRTLARQNLLTFAAQPWTLHNDDPNAGGGGGGGPQLNEHGYPDGTPTAEMTPEHQAAYWKHHARKHEQRANAAPDAAELERLRAADAELATRKAADLSETERLQKERDDAKAEAETARATAAAATAAALRMQVAADKGLTPKQAERLQGSTQEELEADADDLLNTFGTPAPQVGNQRSGGNRGSDVGGTKSIESGAERYRSRFGK
jgi:membrane protein involved in colicin uptake